MNHVGSTTLRLGGQYVSGDRVFKGDREDLTPPAQTDVRWHRWVTTVEIYHQFSEKIGGGIGVPIYDQTIHNNVTGADTRGKGLGDTLFYAIWTPWEQEKPPETEEFLSARNVSIMAGMSVPTGDELQGEVPALHNYHLGSGSVEFKFSARYDGRLSDVVGLFGATSMTIDGGPDSISFRYGNGYDFQIGAAVDPIPSVRLVASVDAVVRDHDKLSTLTLPDTGGTWWFAIFGALISPTKGLWIEPSAALPIYWRVNGVQPVSGVVWSLGVRYQF